MSAASILSFVGWPNRTSRVLPCAHRRAAVDPSEDYPDRYHPELLEEWRVEGDLVVPIEAIGDRTLGDRHWVDGSDCAVVGHFDQHGVADGSDVFAVWRLVVGGNEHEFAINIDDLARI